VLVVLAQQIQPFSPSVNGPVICAQAREKADDRAKGAGAAAAGPAAETLVDWSLTPWAQVGFQGHAGYG
jgi:hypothetical protein